jgi:Uma2 family endonuclease
MADAGLRAGGRLGRTPDLLVLRAAPPATVWVDPAYVSLVVEVVSDGSEDLDHKIKPAEYAAARIAHFWRVDRGHDVDSSVVGLHVLDAEVGGYRQVRLCLLRELLAGDPPDLNT